ncbi:MAG: DivIVA domain-containing protein [Bifidobacterium sp.]|jgi:DivIVA domain-containing protein|nr:DivIVA domain-containing protein [Bifidobacterium sp.]
MAQEPETERDSSGIAHAGKRKWGYNAAQVDAFLERAHSLYEGEYDSKGVQLTQQDIQNVSFDMSKGGYLYAQVDAALDRLERAVVDKQTAWEINQHGRVTWKARTENLYRQIERHVQRDERDRFNDGKSKNPSYDRKQVDRLADQIVDKAAAMLQIEGMDGQDAEKLKSIDSKTVAHTVFTQRKGRRGYDERQVDYFLSACGQLLSRLESYARVSQYLAEHDVQALDSLPHAVAVQPAAQADAQPSQTPAASVRPLFADAKPGADAPSFAPSTHGAGEDTESFDALHKAEQAIFAAPASGLAASVSIPSAVPAASGGDGGHADQGMSGSAGWKESVAPSDRNVDVAAVSPASDIAPHDGEETEVFAPVSDFDGANGHGDYERHGARDGHTSAPASAAQQLSISERGRAAEPVSAGHGREDGRGREPDETQPEERQGTSVDSSLAALAHMAENSQEMPAVKSSPFKPAVPSLDTFSMPRFAFDPVDKSVSPRNAQERDDSDVAQHPDNASFPQTGGDVDLGIPDLSFPSFESEAPDENDDNNGDNGRR